MPDFRTVARRIGTAGHRENVMSPAHAAAQTAHLEKARFALTAAFGAVSIDALLPVRGGASGAYPYRADIGGRRYLVRVEGDPSPLRNPHQYESMRVAADSGLAPRVHRIDEEARVAVMEFIEEQPLAAYPGGPRALARSIGGMLRRVQETPAFPRFIEYPAIVGRLWRWVCETGVFGVGVLDPYTERLERIRGAYVWDPRNSVSSHNDIVPRNILFDGQRLWLIDWESAYRNDPLVDVAIALDNFAPGTELEVVLAEAWHGGALDTALAARLVQVRALTRLYYAGVFLSGSAAVFGPMADSDVSAPAAAEFHRDVRNGTIKPGTPETRHLLGKMYLAAFMTGEVPPGLDAAV